MVADGREGQTRGMGTLETLFRILGVRTGFPLGKSEALGEGREGKGERLPAGRAQVSVPDALPTWARARRQASVRHMPVKEVLQSSLGSLGLGPTSSSLSVSTAARRNQCLPIAPRFLLSELWERTLCGS